eukprot:comp17325_c0_seq1/m.16523 comp17325_c0_seq1/g.16523  ORF comp17325_c0_seq1/g.16523 comp17325_c0_seq1/m.16523 type:complete len:300 (+) comp17325_c0_seq1:927-1826(+)
MFEPILGVGFNQAQIHKGSWVEDNDVLGVLALDVVDYPTVELDMIQPEPLCPCLVIVGRVVQEYPREVGHILVVVQPVVNVCLNILDRSHAGCVPDAYFVDGRDLCAQIANHPYPCLAKQHQACLEFQSPFGPRRFGPILRIHHGQDSLSTLSDSEEIFILADPLGANLKAIRVVHGDQDGWELGGGVWRSVNGLNRWLGGNGGVRDRPAAFLGLSIAAATAIARKNCFRGCVPAQSALVESKVDEVAPGGRLALGNTRVQVHFLPGVRNRCTECRRCCKASHKGCCELGHGGGLDGSR